MGVTVSTVDCLWRSLGTLAHTRLAKPLLCPHFHPHLICIYAYQHKALEINNCEEPQRFEEPLQYV